MSEKNFKLFDEIYMIEGNKIVKVVWCNRFILGCTGNEKDDIDVVTKNFEIKKEQKGYRMSEEDTIKCSKDKLFAKRSEAIDLLFNTNGILRENKTTRRTQKDM